MKKLICLLLLAAPFLFAVSNALSEKGEIDLALYGNYWDVKDGDDNVWGPGIALAIPLYANQLKLDIRGTWLPDAGQDVLGDISLVPVDMGLSWHFNKSEPLDVYILGGASWVFSNTDLRDDLGVGVKLEDDTWGAYTGAGVRYDFVDNFGVFSNVYYRFVEFDVETAHFENISGTYDADGLNVDVGLVYSF